MRCAATTGQGSGEPAALDAPPASGQTPVSLAQAVRAFNASYYPLLASKAIAEQSEYGHEAAAARWLHLCQDLLAMTNLAVLDPSPESDRTEAAELDESDMLDALACELGVASVPPADHPFVSLHTSDGLRQYSWIELVRAHLRLMGTHRREPAP